MLRALREFVVRLLLKDSPKGVMTTLPNKDLVDMNVQMTAEFLMRNGVDPNSLKNANQVENAINMIENKPRKQKTIGEARGIKSTKSAKVFDLEGKEIDPKKGIMGGKQIPDDDLPPPGSRGGPDDIAAPVQSAEESLRDMTEAEIKKRLEKQNKEAAKRFKDKMKDDPEDMATGGRAGFKVGGIDKARRAFLKTVGAVGAGIGALKTGLLSIGKGADAVKNIPPIKTPVTKLEGTTTEMPDWFPSFINKFRDEGKAENVFKQKKVEVSKAEYDKAIAEGKGENYYTDVARTPEYKANNPDHMDYFKMQDTDERIFTTYTNDKIPGVRVDDMDGNIDVMFENDYSQPVSLNYTAPGKKGPETGRVDEFVQGQAKMEPKPKGEFVANDVEVYATDPDGGSEAVDVIANTVDDMLEGTTRTMEEYVTGKKTKLSKGEGRMIEAEIRAEQAADAAAEAAADAADEFSSGGIARMLGE